MEEGCRDDAAFALVQYANDDTRVTRIKLKYCVASVENWDAKLQHQNREWNVGGGAHYEGSLVVFRVTHPDYPDAVRWVLLDWDVARAQLKMKLRRLSAQLGGRSTNLYGAEGDFEGCALEVTQTELAQTLADLYQSGFYTLKKLGVMRLSSSLSNRKEHLVRQAVAENEDWTCMHVEVGNSAVDCVAHNPRFGALASTRCRRR